MRSGPRAEVGLAVLLCLLGAFVLLVAAGRSWAVVELPGTGLLPARAIGVPGSALVPGLQALGLVGLAGVVAVAATRGWGRIVVGAVLLVVGGGVLALTAGLLSDLTTAALDTAVVRDAGGTSQGVSQGTVAGTGWPILAALGGLLLAAAGLLVAARGRRWAALSRRYDAPATRTQTPPPASGPVAERELWEALDRGEDPTAR